MQDQPPAWFQWVPLFLFVIIGLVIYHRNRSYKRRNFMLPLDPGLTGSPTQNRGGLPLGVKIFGWLTALNESLSLPSWIRGEHGSDVLAASWSLWTYQLFLSIALLTSAVTLLSSFRWARRLTVYVISARLAVLVIDLVIYGSTGTFWERPLFHFKPDVTSGAAFLHRSFVVGLMILFDSFLIFYFTRRKVKAAFDLPNQRVQPTRSASDLGLTPDGWPRG